MIRLSCAIAIVVAAAFALSWPSPAEACAGCSNPNLPGARPSMPRSRAGEVSAAVGLTVTRIDVVHSDFCPDIGPICAVRDEPGQLHDQRFDLAELRPLVDVGLSDTFGVELQLPFRYTRTSIVYRRLDGTAFTPDYENIHHRNEALTGFSDPWLRVRGTWRVGNVELVPRLGVSLPLGSIQPDPFEAGREGRSHQHIQFGTGTVNPLLSLDAVSSVGRFGLAGYAQTMGVFFTNRYGYRAGHRYAAGVAADSEITSGLRLGLGADLLNEQPERWRGIIQQDGNVGRTDLLVGGTIRYPLGAVDGSLMVKVPVWQHFIQRGHAGEPGQLTYPAIVTFAVGYPRAQKTP